MRLRQTIGPTKLELAVTAGVPIFSLSINVDHERLIKFLAEGTLFSLGVHNLIKAGEI